jgi:hypothetical protein
METYNHVRKLFFVFALGGYISVALFGITHIAHMTEMGMPVQNCPFALGTHSLCQMSGALHEEIWKSFSIASLAIYTFFLFTVFLTLFSLAIYFPSPSPESLLQSRRNRTMIIPLFRDLFSQGILNPKAP